MPTRKGSPIVLLRADDPQALVRWLCDTYGQMTILQAVAQYQPSEAPTKRAAKKRGPKKGGSKKAAKKGSKKAGKKDTRGTGPGGAGETGNG